MKTKSYFYVVLLLCVVTVTALVGCTTVTKYTIQFETYGGTAIESLQFAYNEEIVLPANPEKANYNFAGWYLDADFEELFKDTVMPNNDIVLYAKWTGNLVTVKFESNGGTKIEDEIGEVHDSCYIPNNPTKENCIFGGWYLDKDFSNEFNFEYPETDITVYAKWLRLEEKTAIDLNKNWISRDANAYEINETLEGVTINALPGKDSWSYVQLNITQNVKEYDVFVMELTGTADTSFLLKLEGANKDSIIDNVEKSFTMTGETQTIVWEIDENNLTDGSEVLEFLLFVNQGNTGGDVTMTINSLKLYRQVLENEEDNNVIFFESNGGSVVDPLYAVVGSEIEAPADPVRGGYQFDGWYMDDELTQEFVFDKMPTDPITLYASWIENTNVTITYDTNGGSEIPEVNAPVGSIHEAPDAPTKENCYFVGWYLDEDCQEPFDGVVLDTSFTLYARWDVLETNTSIVFFDFVTPHPTSFDITKTPSNSTLISTTDSKSGWDYFGVKINIDVKAYSVFQLAVKGTEGIDVIFKLQNGGVEAKEITVTMTGEEQIIYWVVSEENLTDGTATMDFYMFLNPNVEGAGASLEIMNIELFKLKQEGTQLDSALFFETNGGSIVNPLYALPGLTILEPTSPTKAGYTFEGWYKDAELTEKFVFDVMPEGKTILYANWTVNEQVTVTFETNGGSDVPSIKNVAGLQIELPTPIKENYFFAGWYLDEEYTEKFFGVLLQENFIVYAKWISVDDPNKVDCNANWIDNDGDAYEITSNGNEFDITSMTGKDDWSYVYTNLGENVFGYNIARFVVQGEAGTKIMFKTRGVEYDVTLTGEVQEVILNIAPFAEGEDLEFLIFIGAGSNGEGFAITVQEFDMYKGE